MNFDPAVLGSLPKKYEEELRRASRPEVGACITAYLDSALRQMFADVDELPYGGATIGRFRTEPLDDHVDSWLGPQPDELRLSIAALYLSGYWRFPEKLAKPLVERLQIAATTLPKHVSAYGYSLLALKSAFTTQKSNITAIEFQAGRQLLQDERQILRETGLHPGILGTLDDLK